MSNEPAITQSKELAQRRRFELPDFPIHKVKDDGTLVPLTKAQWNTVRLNIPRLEAVRNIGQSAMFALADLMANEREPFGQNDRAFGQHLKAHNVEVERNELSAMTSWWRVLSLAEREEAIAYAAVNGINRMVTLRRHFARQEAAKRQAIDVQVHTVADDHAPAKPAKRENTGSRLLNGKRVPAGVSAVRMGEVLEALRGLHMGLGEALALAVLYVQANPGEAALEENERTEEAADTLAAVLGRLS